MVYRAIGMMSGSSLDGLDIAFVEFNEQAGSWSFEIRDTDCIPYETEWKTKLSGASKLSAKDYLLLHAEYGHYLGKKIKAFTEEKQLQYQVSLIASHGHTVFHFPSQKMTAQLGDGSAIAAETGLPVVTDLRSLDVALGGQGAPIVPIGEKLLMPGYDLFLNLGGIANISFNSDPYLAFDICPANRVLNMLANEAGMEYDEGGKLALTGSVNKKLLDQLNAQDYYEQAPPKSLANEFGTDVIYPLIKKANLSVSDSLRTYCEHITSQIFGVLNSKLRTQNLKLLVTGGGTFNSFLISLIKEKLKELNIEIVVPGESLVKFKEAMIMAFLGVLRWRQEYNVLSSVTGASRDTVGGAIWTGQEA